MDGMKKERTYVAAVQGAAVKKIIPKEESLAMRTLKATNEELLASAIRDLLKRDNLD